MESDKIFSFTLKITRVATLTPVCGNWSWKLANLNFNFFGFVDSWIFLIWFVLLVSLMKMFKHCYEFLIVSYLICRAFPPTPNSSININKMISNDFHKITLNEFKQPTPPSRESIHSHHVYQPLPTNTHLTKQWWFACTLFCKLHNRLRECRGNWTAGWAPGRAFQFLPPSSGKLFENVVNVMNFDFFFKFRLLPF